MVWGGPGIFISRSSASVDLLLDFLTAGVPSRQVLGQQMSGNCRLCQQCQTVTFLSKLSVSWQTRSGAILFVDWNFFAVVVVVVVVCMCVCVCVFVFVCLFGGGSLSSLGFFLFFFFLLTYFEGGG